MYSIRHVAYSFLYRNLDMARRGVSPGPIADRTFDLGWKVATGGGFVCVAVFFWTGSLSIYDPFHVVVTLLLFPIYLVSVAILLGIWLGYDTDETDLQLASDETTDERRDPWKDWPW